MGNYNLGCLALEGLNNILLTVLLLFSYTSGEYWHAPVVFVFLIFKMLVMFLQRSSQ